MQKHFYTTYGEDKTDLLENLLFIEAIEKMRELETDSYVALLQKFDGCVNETSRNSIILKYLS